ncbi:capsular biosynthesis protein [Roseomonas sp. SSH11]|uniref:Capsular biosynthesis protein n=1 Tax=Pararoseomonas baculiformis TaxID=2820812 RepID=A0ABS4AB84_9PROT|nr:capsular biosynthesis protein [Pararoseomonas baculiformis]MBP0444259.1 capsular biosynthesis protein [Pararoseomonas baculiformis]
MQRLVLDLDGTITLEDPGVPYAEKQPNLEVVEQIRRYKAQGFEIIIQSARNMRTFKGSVGKITAFTLPVIVDWLKKHDIPFDEIHVGKPWCGTDGFYVDDRAIRPDEFVKLSLDEIHALIGKTSAP